MAKNPVFEFFKKVRGEPNSPSPVTLRGTSTGSSDIPVQQAPFSYFGMSFATDDGILDTIYGWPHANDVLVDSSFFSPARLDLIRRLLIDRPVLLINEVQDELNELKPENPKKTLSDLPSILFDTTGKFNQRLECASGKWMRGYEYPINRYVNLLHTRRRILEKPLRDFEKREGRRPVGKDLIKLQHQILAQGFSQRTLSLGRKGDKKRRYTDEVLSIQAVLRPIIVGRDCFVLTADRDVFEQIFQFTQLLHEDYGSFLIAQDFARNPDRYTHRHKISTPLMEPGAIAIGRVREPDYLLPSIFHTCAVSVIDVRTREFLVWVCTREVEQMLDFQSRSADGRVADGGNGLNVHIGLPTRKCRDAQAHFVVGEDRIVYDLQSSIGPIRISYFDLYRVMSDKLPADSSARLIWTPGRPIV